MLIKAQTFFIDPQLVLGTNYVFITSVEVYFKSKPKEGATISGITKPGVTCQIIGVKDGKPDPNKNILGMSSRVEYDNINVSSDSLTSTKFSFKRPGIIPTNETYAFCFIFDGDETFEFWKNKAGEGDISTGEITKVSSGKVDGNYFEITNGYSIDSIVDTDLKFKLNVADFQNSTSNTFTIVNEAYEFISLVSGSTSNTFIPGEYVYQLQSNVSGTVNVVSTGVEIFGTGTDFGNTTATSSYLKISNNDLVVIGNSSVIQVRKVNVVTNTTYMNVTSAFTTSANGVNLRTFEDGTLITDSTSNVVIGTNTSFNTVLSAGDFVVITDGTNGNTEVRQVISVTNSSHITLDVVPSFSNNTAGYFISPVGKVDTYKSYSDHLILYKSSANSSYYFGTNKIVRGVDSLSSSTTSSIDDIDISRFTCYFNPFIPTGTSANLTLNFSNSSYSYDSNNLIKTDFGKDTYINFPGIIGSRSNEVNNSGNLFANSKSMNAKLTFNTANRFVSPMITVSDLNMAYHEFIINNDSTNESYSNGASDSKYISKIINLSKDQIAEDLIVYMTAYRPVNTDIEVYAKFLSEEDNEFLNEKNWTKLIEDSPTNSSAYSADFNRDDFIGLKYIVPNFQSGTEVTTGTFNVASATNVITGNYSTVNTDILAGSLVKIYNPIFPDTYFVDSVVSSNTTTFTVSSTISNNDVVGSGLLVNKITDTNSGFKNNQNFNILRYFNKGMARYDGFKYFSIKIVLKSTSHYKVPSVKEFRAIAVSA